MKQLEEAVILILVVILILLGSCTEKKDNPPQTQDPEKPSMFQSGVYYDDMVDHRYAMQIAMKDGSTIAVDSIWNVDDSAYYFIEHGTWKDRKIYFHECYGILFIHKQKE